MPADLSNTLMAYDAALNARPMSYNKIIAADRELEVPADVTSAQLEKLYSICFKILGINAHNFPAQMRNDMDAWQADHLMVCAQDQIERTMFDTNGANRAHTAKEIKKYQDKGQPMPEWLAECELPPALNIPWDVDTAQKHVNPFLLRIEDELATNPSAHFRLCWSILNDRYREGYPIFKQVFLRWMKNLQQRAIGWPGTVEAFARCHDLDSRMENGKHITWIECKHDILPLLEHDHPMVAGSAARFLGQLYDIEAFEDNKRSPGLVAILEMLRGVRGFREIVCGGFVCGFDDGATEGLSSLTNNNAVKEANFDIDQWIIDALAPGKPAPDLPNTQSLWFYIHEHYCYAPEMPMRLIEMDRAWVALMCATEMNEPIDGMKPVLERLAKDTDDDISARAKQHLAQHYSV